MVSQPHAAVPVHRAMCRRVAGREGGRRVHRGKLCCAPLHSSLSNLKCMRGTYLPMLTTIRIITCVSLAANAKLNSVHGQTLMWCADPSGERAEAEAADAQRQHDASLCLHVQLRT